MNLTILYYFSDWFACLSDEIILMVFKWLPKVSLIDCAVVCKRWHDLTTDETLWTRLDCSLNVLNPGSTGHILSRQVLVLRLSQTEVRIFLIFYIISLLNF